MLRPLAKSSTAAQTAPDWLINAMLPARGIRPAKLAFILTSGLVLITPRQFGPTIRIP